MNKQLAITTVTYNDRPSLPLVVAAFLENTEHLENVTWLMVLQNCSDAFVAELVQLCRNRIKLVLVRFARNLGLSKAMNYAIQLTKSFEYVLNIEDDWMLLHTHVPSKDWLNVCVDFMQTNADVSTLFLRAYNSPLEKWQYGWTRTIPYVCHKFKDNFNYEAKMREQSVEKTVSGGAYKFSLIPNFLFTFNPCLVRNADYHKTAYPLPVFSKDQKDPALSGEWGHCEALTMEKTRHLTTYWCNQGLFGHYEDFFPFTAS